MIPGCPGAASSASTQARIRSAPGAETGPIRSVPMAKSRMQVALKRAYEAPEPGDGFRVLVDRLWPRGVSRDSAQIDLWLKEIAPSTALRKWFAHDVSKWAAFRDRYFRELDANPDAITQLMEHIRRGRVTLVYGAKDQEHNDAVALKEYLATSRARG